MVTLTFTNLCTLRTRTSTNSMTCLIGYVHGADLETPCQFLQALLLTKSG